MPQTLNVDQVEGHPGGAADSPDVDVEDDSSFAWVVFRQNFDDHPRVLARRLLGSTFDPPVVIDAGQSGSTPRIDLSERGEGTTAVATPDNGVVADMLHLDDFGPPVRLDTPPNADVPAPVPTIGENGAATVSWMQAPTAADATAVHARHWIIDQTKRGFPVPEAGHADLQPDVRAGRHRRRPRCGRRQARRLRDGLRAGHRGGPQARRRRVRPRPRQVLPLRRHRLPVAALPAAEVGAGDRDLGADHLHDLPRRPSRRDHDEGQLAVAGARARRPPSPARSSRPTGASRPPRRRRLRSASTTRPRRCTSRCVDRAGR